MLFIADALHTQTGHADEIARRGAHLLVQVKANQPTLFKQLKRLPWAQIPAGDRTRDRGHGRRETRTVEAVTLRPPGGIAFPHAQQAIRITRTRVTAGRTSRETAYLTISLPTGHANARDLQTWIRRHWHIENRLHHVRDTTFREDQHQARTGHGPAVIATLRNTAIGWHRTTGATNIARATRHANRRSHDLVTAVTSGYPDNAMTLLAPPPPPTAYASATSLKTLICVGAHNRLTSTVIATRAISHARQCTAAPKDTMHEELRPPNLTAGGSPHD
ncbi:putative transposase YbfD/YdcC [Catenuloplanes indicus]|uniref:Transposase YbfD/YdcC n=1 Tax=Catenuloplanes indicus TaxID=137267 RepID=A0AAE3VVQ3_9ACTN|nr:putative transposase YbfD/YdcC [Catenuloplanes indicus]